MALHTCTAPSLKLAREGSVVPRRWRRRDAQTAARTEQPRLKAHHGCKKSTGRNNVPSLAHLVA